MKPSEQLEYQRETLRDLVAHVTPSDLERATPCANWDVRGLINHFVGGAGMFTAAFNGDAAEIDPDAPMPDFVGADPLGAFDAAITGFDAAIDTPGAMDKTVQLPFGAMPAPLVLELLKFDLLVHCWDLATATGQRFDPPSSIAEQALQAAQMMIAPQMRDGDTFADAVTISDGAPAIERLVAFTGRAI